MQTLENDSTVVACVSTDSVTPNVGYEAVRFNAMKHGILSRLAVLAHEDAGEFSDLLAALLGEHQPTGITERHLIEELATIIWRKRRALIAEGAIINRSLADSLCDPFLDLPVTSLLAVIEEHLGTSIQPATKTQTLGEAVQAHRLEKLNRYETHLDRKFERTLAMLLKLKDLRGA